MHRILKYWSDYRLILTTVFITSKINPNNPNYNDFRYFKIM